MTKNRKVLITSFIILTNFNPATSLAQLNECDQINIDATVIPGGCIPRTLSTQIGAGQGDEFTPDSSI
ncbi:MAG: hypothetical protein ACI9FD_001679, partial [Gammaproteobacteria bacterium]